MYHSHLTQTSLVWSIVRGEELQRRVWLIGMADPLSAATTQHGTRSLYAKVLGDMARK